ncbi:UPF0585 protein CG18661 isoform X2 [Drosophila busckii]|uniref:UPF0585 protein CG18661 isoform X2 n=1 Tax=Drosophila busckii TaxID=30019 RepID=UPI00083F004A|nr:UPF0585 protein CG18661 isoform X2 [Drosophila busckii]
MSIKRTHPSADRNSQPISRVFIAQVDKKTPDLQLLEISSGSGQHCGYLAPLFANITFQPTEYERANFPSIEAYAADCATGNIKNPLFVDISQELHQWEPATLEQLKPASFDYVFNSNMMHITPWECSEGLFRAAGQLLKPGGKLFIYGPFAWYGQLTPQSNVDFDADLKRRNDAWGLRDMKDIEQLAFLNGLKINQTVDMPSNNKFLTWVKK